MPTKRLLRKPGAVTASHIPTKRPSPNADALSSLEGLDEDTLLSLSLDAPARLTPSPGNSPLSSPMPIPMQVSDDVMQATLDRLGFGPPNDYLANLPIAPSPTPASSEISTTETSETFGREEGDHTVEEADPTSMDASADEMNAYTSGQILRLFHDVAQRTGQSVNTTILEWALLHAHTDLTKRRVAHAPMSSSMLACQQTFEEEVDKFIELGTKLADVGVDFLFVMVKQNAIEDVKGKVWSTPGLQGMFKDLSLSDEDILAAARMHSYSSMWSRFCKKYKQGSTEPSIEGDGKTAPTAATLAPDMPSYISRQSAIAANAFLSASHKKNSVKQAIERDGPSSDSLPATPSHLRSDSDSRHVPRRTKNKQSAPTRSVLQDLLGHD